MAADRRYHNLTELRLFFALAVLLSHSLQLANIEGYEALRSLFSSERAVQAFFVLSGFLVLGSFDRSKRLSDFYARRALRIYPAYFVAVLFFLLLGMIEAFVAGRAVVVGDIAPYLGANLSLLNFLQDTVGGVFSNNPYPHLNGALWTIKVEVGFYLLVPLVYRTGRAVGLPATGATLLAIGILWNPFLSLVKSLLQHPLHPALGHQLPGQLHFFGLGVLLFHVSKTPKAWLQIALTTALGVALAIFTQQIDTALNMAAIMALVVTVIHLPPLPRTLKVDLSYGIYLSHFPLIQLLVAGRDWRGEPALLAVCVLVAAVAYAWLSWTRIERPLLPRTSP